MEVRAKKALGQHFLVDLTVAQRIVAALGEGSAELRDVLEIGPGMGVLTRYLLQRPELNLKMVELDTESVRFLNSHFDGMPGRLYEADYLKLDIRKLFGGSYSVIGNFPYNISSQIFFKILEDRDRVPEVVCMVQKEVAQRIAEGPGSKVYGILSVLLQAWYDIEYLFTVEPGAFAPPPKVRSAVIRLRRNSRTELRTSGTPHDGTRPATDGRVPQDNADTQVIAISEGTLVDDKLFKQVVKTAFNQRRKTLRNALRPMLPETYDLTDPILQQRAERLSVEDFIALAARIALC